MAAVSPVFLCLWLTEEGKKGNFGINTNIPGSKAQRGSEVPDQVTSQYGCASPTLFFISVQHTDGPVLAYPHE